MTFIILLAVLPPPWGPLAEERPPVPTGPLAEIRTAALPADRTQDAVPLATDGLIEQRKAAYRLARERAERTGFAVYESDGCAGCPLPKGRYELHRQADGDVYYRVVDQPTEGKPKSNGTPQPRKWNEEAVPIPWPDPTMVDPLIVFPRASIQGTSECVGAN